MMQREENDSKSKECQQFMSPRFYIFYPSSLSRSNQLDPNNSVKCTVEKSRDVIMRITKVINRLSQAETD